jgi:hypothetical protein
MILILPEKTSYVRGRSDAMGVMAKGVVGVVAVGLALGSWCGRAKGALEPESASGHIPVRYFGLMEPLSPDTMASLQGAAKQHTDRADAWFIVVKSHQRSLKSAQVWADLHLVPRMTKERASVGELVYLWKDADEVEWEGSPGKTYIHVWPLGVGTEGAGAIPQFLDFPARARGKAPDSWWISNAMAELFDSVRTLYAITPEDGPIFDLWKLPHCLMVRTASSLQSGDMEGAFVEASPKGGAWRIDKGGCWQGPQAYMGYSWRAR